jgi:hypothetical protein
MKRGPAVNRGWIRSTRKVRQSLRNLLGSTAHLVAEPRLGRRIALTFPLFPPPQKN